MTVYGGTEVRGSDRGVGRWVCGYGEDEMGDSSLEGKLAGRCRTGAKLVSYKWCDKGQAGKENHDEGKGKQNVVLPL